MPGASTAKEACGLSPRSASSGGRIVVTLVMDVLFAVAVVVLAHVVITFFGALSSSAWGEGVLRLTRLLVLPLGIKDLATPYGGTFDVNAGITVFALLAVEWVLGLLRRNT